MTDSDSTPYGTIAVPVLIGVATLLFYALVPLALHVWGRRVAQRQGGGWWRKAAWVPILGLGAAAVGAIWSMTLLAQAFETIVALEPSQKASALEQSVQRAMPPTFVFCTVSWGLNVVSFVLSMVGTLKPPRA